MFTPNLTSGQDSNNRKEALIRSLSITLPEELIRWTSATPVGGAGGAAKNHVKSGFRYDSPLLYIRPGEGPEDVTFLTAGIPS